MPPKMYGIKPLDITTGMEIWTDDDSGQGISKFIVNNIPPIKNNILILECKNVRVGLDEEIMVNLSYPREIYTSSLVSGWRKI